MFQEILDVLLRYTITPFDVETEGEGVRWAVRFLVDKAMLCDFNRN